ncbi:hypothetical protein PS2_046256 [Malus domestica]
MLSPCPSPCLCFPTRRRRAISQHLVSIFRSGANCLEPFPDCLPSLALEYSSSSSYASVLSTTSTWGTSKGGENETSKHVETIQLGTRRKRARGGHLERLKKEIRTNTFPSCLPVVQKKQAEKNAACTIIPAEGVRTEELEKLPHLLREQIRNCNITKEQSFAVQYHQIITCK